MFSFWKRILDGSWRFGRRCALCGMWKSFVQARARESHFTDFALSDRAAGRKALPCVILLLVISSPVQVDISRHLLRKPRSQHCQPWPAQYDRWVGLMLRPDASLVEDLLRESPAGRKLKFLNGSSWWRMRSFTLDEHETPFFHQLHFLRLPTSVPQRTHEDPTECPSIPAAHWNPFPVISFAICIRDDSWRCRRLRTRFRPISFRGIRTLAQGWRRGRWKCDLTDTTYLQGRYKFESCSHARIGGSEKWAIAREIDLQ